MLMKNLVETLKTLKFNVFKCFVAFLFVAAVTACSTHSKKIRDMNLEGSYEVDLDKIKIDPDNYFVYSTLYKGIKTIILETDESCLIGAISKMRVFDSYIFILDVRSRCVYMFDKEGRFVRKIGRNGQGPGEYVSPNDFTIDIENKTVYILDAQLQRINKYDVLTGKFIYAINLEKNVRSHQIEYVHGKLYTDTYFFYHTDDNYLLRIIEEPSGQDENHYLNVMEYGKGITNTLGNFQEHAFYLRQNGNVLFVNQFMDHIIEIKKDTIFPLVDFKGKDLLTSDNIKSAIEKGNRGFLNELFQFNKFFYANSFIENEGFIFFDYFKGSSIHRIFINKQSNEVGIFIKKWDDLLIREKGTSFGSMPKLGSFDAKGVYYYLTDSYVLNKLQEAAKAGTLSPNLDKLEEIKQLEEDANPILFYYEFKD